MTDHLNQLIKWAETKKRTIEALNPARSKTRDLAIGIYELFIVRIQEEIKALRSDDGEA
jgi:hypothetical protein